MAKKFLSLERLTEYDGLIKAEIAEGDAGIKSYVNDELAKKADATHSHGDLYYTEDEIDQKFEGVNGSITNITSGSTVVKKAEEATHATSADSAASSTDAEKLGGQLPSYYAKASDIPTGALASKDIVSESDLDTALAEKVNAASEGNHSHLNKDVLDGITADKVSAWDGSLDAAKEYTDTKTTGMATTTVVDNKISDHNVSTEAHSDIRGLISELTTKVNNFLDVDDTTTDQLSEVLELIANNKGTLDSITSSKVNVSDIVDNLTTASADKVLSANQGVELKRLIDALQEAVDGKAGETHSHVIGDVTGLQDALNAKATQESLNSHTGDTVAHITAAERTAWNGIEAKANSYTDGQVSAVSGNLTTHVNNGDIHFTAAERTKLGGVEEGANKTIIDSALSATSENPVQNKVVNSAVSTLTSAISANTQSIESHTTSIGNLQAAIDDIQEISSDEIRALFNA